MLASALGSAFVVCSTFLTWEIVSTTENGFACGPWYSTYGICYFLTRLSELTGRCMGVATFVVFFPFPAGTAAVLLTEEVLIICTVFMAKAYQTPAFLSSMRTGRCGPCKVYSYMLVVLWPMYWCMHTQSYIGAVPRPAFSYRRYYLLRIPFTWARALGLFLTLRFHTHMDTTTLAAVTFASVGGTLAWMVLFPIVRKMAVDIHSTKEAKEQLKKEAAELAAAMAQADSGKPQAVNPLAETPNAEPPNAERV